MVLQGSRRPGCFMCFRQILIVITTSWICRPMCHISTFLGSKDLKILKMLAMNALPDAQHASHPLKNTRFEWPGQTVDFPAGTKILVPTCLGDFMIQLQAVRELIGFRT